MSFIKSTVCSNSICGKLEENGKLTEITPFKPKGIKNIGNTCYMASVLQSMLSVKSLNQYFKNGIYVKSINKNSISNGKIALAYALVVSKYWKKKSSFSPKALKTVLSYINPMVEIIISTKLKCNKMEQNF